VLIGFAIVWIHSLTHLSSKEPITHNWILNEQKTASSTVQKANILKRQTRRRRCQSNIVAVSLNNKTRIIPSSR
uniref:Secreted protein n=1 Tax=Mesocestoides corti TaxID=53468 RepID=A0A5K3FUH1_MESCO